MTPAVRDMYPILDKQIGPLRNSTTEVRTPGGRADLAV